LISSPLLREVRPPPGPNLSVCLLPFFSVLNWHPSLPVAVRDLSDNFYVSFSLFSLALSVVARAGFLILSWKRQPFPKEVFAVRSSCFQAHDLDCLGFFFFGQGKHDRASRIRAIFLTVLFLALVLVSGR